MNDSIKISELFDLNETIAADILTDVHFRGKFYQR